MILSFSQAEEFENIVKMASGLLEEATFTIDKYQLRMRSMDPSNVALLDLKMPKEIFEEYQIEKPTELRINMGRFAKILRGGFRRHHNPKTRHRRPYKNNIPGKIQKIIQTITKRHRKQQQRNAKPRTHIQGGKTVIKNFKKIANKLRRNPKHLLKYLAKELATSGNLEGDQASLKGKFKSYQIKNKLSNYIKEYVICEECGKSDTNLTNFKGTKYKRCEACGARSPVKEI